jgi:hypothetical protein
MNLDRFIVNVNNVDWQQFDDAEYFKYRHDGINSFAQTVPQSLIALALAELESKECIYQIAGITPDLLLNAPVVNDVMYAIGNNHSGTYYPVIRKALPFIIQLALLGNHMVSRNCSINILIDLYYFYPEDDSNELFEFVRKTISDVIRKNREEFSKFAVDNKKNSSLIESLISIIDEEQD